MPNRPPRGNLTATLVVVALLELIVGRLLGRLFLSPGCHAGLGCLVLRGGPYLLHLTGALTLVVAAGGMVGHLKRGELFPRGMRLTIAALCLIFLLLLAVSLFFGRLPERYQIHLETSFGFVVALLLLSFVGSEGVSARARAGFALFALPVLLHVAALVAARGDWLTHGAVTPERLIALGEIVLLFAAVTSPLLLPPVTIPATRVGAGLALAAGVTAFFFVAFLGRTDLVQTVALYGVQLELPRALSLLGGFYVLALFGFLTAVTVLLLSPGPTRLTGLGVCLMGIAGYQTSSPVSLGLSLCGLLSLATGLKRAALTVTGSAQAPLAIAAWKSLLGAVAHAISDAPTIGEEPLVVEVTSAGNSLAAGDSDTGSVRTQRRGRAVVLTLRRFQSIVREIDATVGTPGDSLADATIESHEAWLGRPEEDRVSLPRVKTGDSAFDRKLSVHGRAPVQEPELRRRILSLSEGTITLWAGRAARFVAPGNPTEPLRRFTLPTGAAATRSLVGLVDTLIDLIEASEQGAPPDVA
jgi:hypothetical protein